MQSNNNKEIKVIKVVESNINNNNISQETTCCTCNDNFSSNFSGMGNVILAWQKDKT